MVVWMKLLHLAALFCLLIFIICMCGWNMCPSLYLSCKEGSCYWFTYLTIWYLLCNTWIKTPTLLFAYYDVFSLLFCCNHLYESHAFFSQLEASTTHQGVDQQMPSFNLPSKILCKVVHVQLRVRFCSPSDLKIITGHFHLHLLSFSTKNWLFSNPCLTVLFCWSIGRARNWWSVRTNNFATWTRCKLFHPFSYSKDQEKVVFYNSSLKYLHLLSKCNCF